MKRAWLLAGVCAVLLFGWGWTARQASGSAPHAASEASASTTATGRPSLRPAAHAASPGDTAARIRGQVRDARGPVAGARVLASAEVAGETLSTLPCGENSEQPLLECHESDPLVELVLQRAGEAPVLASATTGTDGAFLLEGLPPGPYALWVESPEGVALRRDVSPGDGDVTLVLEPGVRVSGLVSGEDKAPLAGALVTAIPKLHSRFFETLTDASGHFALGTLPRGEYAMVVTREGRVPRWLEFLGYSPRKDLNLVLESPRRLSGVVLREGVPVAGAAVHIASHLESHERRGRTDAQGGFSFDDLPPQSSYELEATHEGTKAALSVEFEDSRNSDLPLLTERTHLTLELTPAVGLRGDVRDTAGRPVEAARVDVYTESLDLVASVQTDAQGHYAAEYLTPDTFHIETTVVGHRPARSPPVEVQTGTGRADLVLAPATVLTGILVDAEERPVADKTLVVSTLDASESFQAWSDEAGRFSVDLPAAGRYLLRVASKRALHARPDMEVTAPGDVRVHVERRPRIHGEVVDETNLPLPGVDVSLWSADASDRTQLEFTLTDSRGRFEMSAPAEGTYALSAEFLLGNDLRLTGSRQVVVGPRGAETRVRLEGGHALSGVVVDSRGWPVEDAHVEIIPPLHARPPGCGSRYPRGQWTDPDGRFHFQQVSGEGLALTVYKEGFALSCRDQAPERAGMLLPAGAREVRVTLVKEAAVRGRLVRADGTPVENYDINGSYRNNPQGRFAWDFTCAGPLTLELSELKKDEPGAPRLRRTVTVQEEQDLNVGTLVLEGP